MNVQKLLYQNIFWRGLFFGSGFILNVLVARVLGADTTGWLYYLFALFSFFTLIAGFSLEAAIIYFGSKGEISLKSLADFSWRWTGIIAALIILIYGLSFLTTKPIPFQQFYYALLFIVGNVLMVFMSALFYARKNYIISNLAAISVNLLLILLIFLLDAENFIVVYFSSYLFLGIVLSVIVFMQLPPASVSNTNVLRKLFRYSALAFVTNLVSFLLYKIDYWFVNRYTSDLDLGNYIQVSKVVQMFFLIPGVIAQALFPIFATGQIKKAQAHLQLLSRSIFLFYLIVCILFAISGKWLFPLVFGPSFFRMHVPFVLLIPGILALSTMYSLTAWFSGNNLIRVNLTGSVLATILIIAGDAIFIPRFGIEAAALVSSIGYIVYHAYVLHVFNRMHGAGYLSFFLFRSRDLKTLKSLLTKP